MEKESPITSNLLSPEIEAAINDSRSHHVLSRRYESLKSGARLGLIERYSAEWREMEHLEKELERKPVFSESELLHIDQALVDIARASPVKYVLSENGLDFVR